MCPLFFNWRFHTEQSYIKLVQPTTTLLKELSKSIHKKPAHITHIEFSFHLSLFRPSETLWFGCDNGTTVLTYLLYSMTSTTHDFVAERVIQVHNKPAHITHIEFSFHLSLFRPSETLWFGRDNGTTVLAYFLYSMMMMTRESRHSVGSFKSQKNIKK